MPTVILSNHPSVMQVYIEQDLINNIGKVRVVFKDSDKALLFSTLTANYSSYGCDDNSTPTNFVVIYKKGNSIVEIEGNLFEFHDFIKKYDHTLSDAIEANTEATQIIEQTKNFVLTEKILDAMISTESSNPENTNTTPPTSSVPNPSKHSEEIEYLPTSTIIKVM